MDPIRLGPFSMDMAASRLFRDSVELELRPQAFHVLKALIHNSGCCLDHEQMIRAAWHGVSVSKHTVAVTVAELRNVLQEYGSWIRYRPRIGYCLDLPQSGDLVRRGWLLGNRLTREGLEKALCCFQEAALVDGPDLQALEGIALTYLMLGTYGMRPPREMYKGFFEAHSRALALSGLTPAIRGERAHALFIFERRFAEAESELLQAVHEEPSVAENYVRLAMLYATRGLLDDAHCALKQARAADVLWPTLSTAEIIIQICRGDFESAVQCGKNGIDLHPYLPLVRVLYADALGLCGRIEEGLTQYHLACVFHPDIPWLRALEATCLAKIGREPEASETVRSLEELRSTEYVDAYYMALPLDALGKRNEAFQELERACSENSASLFLLDVDRRMDGLRGDPRFTSLRNKVFCESDSHLSCSAVR